MTFTPLETMLLAAFLSCITGIFVKMRCVSPKECEHHRQAYAAMLAEMRESNDISRRMLQVLMTHSNLPPEVQAEILNMTSGK